jgi:hypothetical protein
LGEIRGLIDQKTLCEVPTNVYQKRRAAAVDAAAWHLGRFLTLLWDDPRRPLPPDDDDTNPHRSPIP